MESGLFLGVNMQRNALNTDRLKWYRLQWLLAMLEQARKEKEQGK